MRSLFAPSRIAVVGASADSSKVGNIIIRNILASGFKGEVYPINPREKNILGLTAYKSIFDLPEEVDLAIFTIPAKFVAEAMDNAGKAGVKSAIVISAGFREEGPDGMRLEKELEKICSRHGIRTVGPNCFGVMDTYSDLNATFSSLYPNRGNISLSSQSGAVGTSVLDWSSLSHRGLSKFLSLGNKMDVDESDVIDFIHGDQDTDVLALYVESIRNGMAFMDSARLFTRDKPLLVLKAGRTGQGAKAASSHTGALAGSDSVYDSAIRKVNAIRVKDMEELFDALSLFSSMPLIKGDGVAVLTNAGGLGVMAADACGDYGLALADLHPDTVHRLEAEVPSLASATNPVDIRGDASSQDFRRALETISEDQRVFAIIALISPVDTVDMNEVATLLSDFRGGCDMPLVASFVGGEECQSPIRILREKNIPDYPTPDRAVRALSMMLAYCDRKMVDDIPMPLPETHGQVVAQRVIDKVLVEGRRALTEGEGKEILSAYGISVPREGDAACASAAADL
ncbi:MAG: CoA-binding protein, partial [Candidatus Methanomethylophilaceae archaeon]